MKLPEILSEKLNAYKSEGKVIQYPWEIFGKDSWLAILDGFKIYPEKYDARVNNMEIDYLNNNLTYMAERVKSSVRNAPTHGEFLKKHCQFEAKN